jgi:hypothetical protein
VKKILCKDFFLTAGEGDGAAGLNVIFTPEPATLLLLALGGLFLRKK